MVMAEREKTSTFIKNSYKVGPYQFLINGLLTPLIGFIIPVTPFYKANL